MARRTGVPSLLDAARELCRLLAKFNDIIVLLYPSSPALHAALAAANAACATLAQELNKVREYGD